jgi:hypothetical protein
MTPQKVTYRAGSELCEAIEDACNREVGKSDVTRAAVKEFLERHTGETIELEIETAEVLPEVEA